MSNTTSVDYSERWRAAMAPRTGDILRELTREAADYLGISCAQAEQQVETSATDFPREWQ